MPTHRLVAEMTRERIAKAFLDPYADPPARHCRS